MGEFFRSVFIDSWFARWVFRPVVFFYLVLVCIGLFLSDRLIFGAHRDTYSDDESITKLTTADGITISARYLENPTATYTILYSHGNGEDLGDDSDILQDLVDMGFSVFAYDYHGYGTSGGKPSEANVYHDIDAAYAYLTTTRQIPPNRIIIFGRSLGGGPSIDLASRRPVAGLIVQSAFTTAFRIWTQVSLLPFDKFRSIEKIGRVRCPVLVMHGTADNVIPFSQGVELYNAVKSPKCHLWVDGAGHDDLREVADVHYEEAMHDLLNLVEDANRQ